MSNWFATSVRVRVFKSGILEIRYKGKNVHES